MCDCQDLQQGPRKGKMESDSERQGLGALTCRVIVLIEQAFDCSWLAHVNQAAGLAHICKSKLHISESSYQQI